MNITLRPAKLPDDYEELAELLSMLRDESITVERLSEEDIRLPEGSVRYQVVAQDEHSFIRGYAEAFRWPNTRAGKFYVTLVIDKNARGIGVGTALLTDIETFARAHGGTLLVGEVPDHETGSLGFAQRRGYDIRRHSFTSTLNLSGFDDRGTNLVLEGVRATGIRFFTLAEAPGEQTERALYELMSRTMADLPGYEAERFMDFETWHDWVVNGVGTRPDGVIIAAEGEKLVGVTTSQDFPDYVYTPHTSVDREYRGRRIALALKLLAIRRAKHRGVAYIRTGNDSENAPMLAINQRLGFVHLSGEYEVTKQIG